MKKKCLAAMLAGSVMLAGCGSENSNTKYDTSVFKDFFVKGTDFETLNYLNSSAAVNSRVFQQCVVGWNTTDQYGNIVNELADSIEPNEDYTQWTFKLKKGLKWVTRDGKEYAEIKAQDFVTSMKWQLTASNGSTSTEMATSHLKNAAEYLEGSVTDFSQVGISTPDEYTVVYDLKIPAPWFDTVVLYSSFYPLNEDFLNEKQGNFGNSPDNILYNGPYILTEYTNDTDKKFEANKAYWDADNVSVKTVTSIGVKDVESTKELFERGELSYCQLTGTQPVAEDRNGNEYMYQSDPEMCAYVFYMNDKSTNENAGKAIRNENFRKAIFYGWDRTEYVEQTDPINPESIFTYGFTAPGFVKTSDGTDYTQLGELKKWQSNQYDKEKGQDYFAKAKAELEAEGVTFPVAIPYWFKAGNESASNTATVLKATLEEAFDGQITLDIKEYANSYRSDVIVNNDHGLSGAGWIPDYQDPANMMGCLIPGPGGYMNGPSGYSRWEYPEFVAMYNEACAEVKDLDKRYEMFANCEAWLLEHAYYIPLYRAGVQYRMAAYNPYSRQHNNYGAEGYSYKTVELSDHVYTAKEIAQFKKDWEAKR